MKYSILLLLIAALNSPAGTAQESDFAGVMISGRGPFGAYPYNDPNTVLGPPTTVVLDGWNGKIFTPSLVYPAWNVTPNRDRTILTLGTGSEVVIGFDHNVSDDLNNLYGVDFIVFSNTFFKRQGAELTPTTDMASVWLAAPASINDEWVTVHVAQDPNGPWYAFPNGPAAGQLFPTNPFAWDNAGGQWGDLLDFLKPVNPALTLADFSGLSVPEAIALYDGSAGGTGFDLHRLSEADYDALRTDPETGRKYIRYVKLTSDEWGEVDAVADVAACGDYAHPFPPGDANMDCRVDLADFAVLAENWMVCTWHCEREP